MKTALYVATVARTYRKAIDDYLESPEKYRENMQWYQSEISKCTYRMFTTGFYFGKPDENTQIYDNNTYVNEYIYLGIVKEISKEELPSNIELPQGTVSVARIEQRNKFCTGDVIEVMKPDGRNEEVNVLAIYDESGEAVESAPHPKQVLYVALSNKADTYDLLRVKNNIDR